MVSAAACSGGIPWAISVSYTFLYVPAPTSVPCCTAPVATEAAVPRLTADLAASFIATPSACSAACFATSVVAVRAASCKALTSAAKPGPAPGIKAAMMDGMEAGAVSAKKAPNCMGSVPTS